MVVYTEWTDRELALRPEQKSIAWMKDLMSKFSNAGNLMHGPCAGTLATFKPCIMLRKHRLFLGRKN